jgi:hypothetical protein
MGCRLRQVVNPPVAADKQSLGVREFRGITGEWWRGSRSVRDRRNAVRDRNEKDREFRVLMKLHTLQDIFLTMSYQLNICIPSNSIDPRTNRVSPRPQKRWGAHAGRVMGQRPRPSERIAEEQHNYTLRSPNATGALRETVGLQRAYFALRASSQKIHRKPAWPLAIEANHKREARSRRLLSAPGEAVQPAHPTPRAARARVLSAPQNRVRRLI